MNPIWSIWASKGGDLFILQVDIVPLVPVFDLNQIQSVSLCVFDLTCDVLFCEDVGYVLVFTRW